MNPFRWIVRLIERRLATDVARPEFGNCPGCGAKQTDPCTDDCRLIDPYDAGYDWSKHDS